MFDQCPEAMEEAEDNTIESTNIALTETYRM